MNVRGQQDVVFQDQSALPLERGVFSHHDVRSDPDGSSCRFDGGVRADDDARSENHGPRAGGAHPCTATKPEAAKNCHIAGVVYDHAAFDMDSETPEEEETSDPSRELAAKTGDTVDQVEEPTSAGAVSEETSDHFLDLAEKKCWISSRSSWSHRLGKLAQYRKRLA